MRHIRLSPNYHYNRTGRHIVCYGNPGELGYVVVSPDQHTVYQSSSKSDVIAESQRRNGYSPVDGSEQTYGRQIDEATKEAA